MNSLLYKLQLCGYDNKAFLRIVNKTTFGKAVKTARIKRLYAVTIILCFAIVPIFFLPYTVAFANLLLSPVEIAVKKIFLNKASHKLAKFPNLIKIGITGSYGKTTVKNILAQILSVQYKVVASRESFNTPMGFARTVNDDLTDDAQILIMEMGARHVGDIKEMCDLLKPQHGIITGIGECHLETFGSIENVKKTKYELFEALPKDGIALDYTQTFPPAPPHGLLGRHNNKNAALCAEFSRRLGIKECDIKSAVKNLKPIPHRLELIESSNGVRIIDDGYNANPVGAKSALEVLTSFDGKKIVQTPGFAEQGDNAYKSNFEFGRQIAEAADTIIIVGTLNKQALLDGITKGSNYGTQEMKPLESSPRTKQFRNTPEIHFADNLEEAKKLYPHILQSGDTLLIENDLPENY
jgi:UDP-N-acetylmuramoyl-tripeptide--D-alanyl-D-alanine ligase